MSNFLNRVQSTTLASATRHNDEWTNHDLDFLSAFKDDSIAELALALGRTYLSVATRRRLLDERDAARIARQRFADSDDRSFGAWARAHSR